MVMLMAGTRNPPNSPICAYCGLPMTYIPQHRAWYCYPCCQYGTSGGPAESVSQAGERSPDIAPACGKCGTRTTINGRCPRCDAEEVISLAERLMEDVFAQGVNIAKAGPVLRTAKEQFRAGVYPEAKASAEAAMKNVEQSEDEYARATDQIADADDVTAQARREGKEVGQAESFLNVARSFLKSGNYMKSADYAKRARGAAKEAERGRQDVATPQPSGMVREAVEPGLSCPNCGGEVQAGWKRCPVCTTPLSHPQPAPSSASGKTGTLTPSAAPESKVQQGPPPQEGGIEAAKPPDQESELNREEDHIKVIREKLAAMQDKGMDMTQALMTLEVSRSFLQTKNLKKASQYARKAENLAKDASDRIGATETATAFFLPATETKEAALAPGDATVPQPAGSGTGGIPKLPEASRAERDIEAAREELRKTPRPADAQSITGHRYDLAEAFLAVAELFMETGRYEKAAQHAIRALKLLSGPHERSATGSEGNDENRIREQKQYTRSPFEFAK